MVHLLIYLSRPREGSSFHRGELLSFCQTMQCLKFCFDSLGLVERGLRRRESSRHCLSRLLALSGFTAPNRGDGGVGYDVWGQRRDCRGVARGLQGLAADCREVHVGCREVQEVHTVDWPGLRSGPTRSWCCQGLQEDQP